MNDGNLSRIKLVGFDIDGTLTDGGFYYLGQGQWAQRYSVWDGYGIRRLQIAGIQVAVVTNSDFESAMARVKMLGIDEAHFSVTDKLKVWTDILDRHNLKPENCAYMGDDLPDLPVLQQVGFSGTVFEAQDCIKRECDFVASRPAGNGAAREFIEYILSHRGGD